jgi:hypothetical protein
VSRVGGWDPGLGASSGGACTLVDPSFHAAINHRIGCCLAAIRCDVKVPCFGKRLSMALIRCVCSQTSRNVMSSSGNKSIVTGFPARRSSTLSLPIARRRAPSSCSLDAVGSARCAADDACAVADAGVGEPDCAELRSTLPAPTGELPSSSPLPSSASAAVEAKASSSLPSPLATGWSAFKAPVERTSAAGTGLGLGARKSNGASACPGPPPRKSLASFERRHC